MGRFLSLDWGTSALRLRLVNAPELTIVGETSSDQGISKTYSGWQAAKQENGGNRLSFYLAVIQGHLQQLETQLQDSLANVPMVVSGMASATVGMLELTYQPVPFALDGSGVKSEFILATNSFKHDLYLISGICTQTDVMRGEETQLIGFATQAQEENQEQIYIFPGTHSKHIWVKHKQVVGFKTYMTGEFFSLLAEKSILKASVAENQESTLEDLSGFRTGVRAARQENLLHGAFRVRTNELFGKLTKVQNRQFLSGLLIGTELQELVNSPAAIYLCGGANLHLPYATALQELNLPNPLHIYPPQLADEAVIRGQYQIFKQLTQPK